MRLSPKTLLVIALGLIAVIFCAASVVAYQQFHADFIRKEISAQQKMSRIVNQSMNRYFETLRFITENAALQSAFAPERTAAEDELRFKTVSLLSIREQIERAGITSVLSGPRLAENLVSFKQKTAQNWMLYKGLPEYDLNGQLVARDRRSIARSILKAFKDIHYVFEMDRNGNLVFLEPFEIQKNITSFNYEFRDYLRLVKSSRSTAISEGYISHDQDRTQIITIASPIFDSSGNVAKLFAVSVSAATLRERVFRSLKENMDLQDGTTFSLVDRHGHIVASSSGKNIYFPTEGELADEGDRGNLRSTGFFSAIDWKPDVLEKGNVWERNTKSWLPGTLKEDYTGQYTNLSGVNVFGTFFPTAIIGSESTNWGILIETPVEQLLASERELKRVFYVAGSVLAVILLSLSFMTIKNFAQLERQIQEKEQEVAQIASQVAHDIRSPLAALDMVMDCLGQLPEDRRVIIRSAVSRISDIANNLLGRRLTATEGKEKQVLRSGQLKSRAIHHGNNVSCQLISTLISSIITEKRIEYRSRLGVEISSPSDASSYGVFANVDPVEFKRVISNLLNNAIEAINGSGKVEVCIHGASDLLEILVKDTGAGIAPELLPMLMRPGQSFGKENGHGLGLWHAKKSIESWGGAISINSVLGQGSTVTITLPRAKAPSWFVPELVLSKGMIVAVLDDDSSVHQIWQGRFESLRTSGFVTELHHFSRPCELSAWLERQPLCSAEPSNERSVLFLIDYELLGESENGIDVIEKHDISAQSLLVTSRFEEPEIRAKCERLGVRLVPKGMAGFVPIRVKSVNCSNTAVSQHFDAVLVDDDPLVHLAWQMSARRAKKSLAVFKGEEELKRQIPNMPKDLPIYIDSNLLGKLPGEEVARQLSELGFTNLYLATAYASEAFEAMPWIKAVIGKAPPWSHNDTWST